MTEDKRSIIQMVAGLIEQGKKNQDKIAYSKILDTFSGVEISSEQFDNILKVLEDNKIEVLRSKNDMEQTVSLSAKEKELDVKKITSPLVCVTKKTIISIHRWNLTIVSINNFIFIFKNKFKVQ